MSWPRDVGQAFKVVERKQYKILDNAECSLFNAKNLFQDYAKNVMCYIFF